MVFCLIKQVGDGGGNKKLHLKKAAVAMGRYEMVPPKDHPKPSGHDDTRGHYLKVWLLF